MRIGLNGSITSLDEHICAVDHKESPASDCERKYESPCDF